MLARRPKWIFFALDSATQNGDVLIFVGLFASLLVCVTAGDISVGSNWNCETVKFLFLLETSFVFLPVILYDIFQTPRPLPKWKYCFILIKLKINYLFFALKNKKTTQTLSCEDSPFHPHRGTFTPSGHWIPQHRFLAAPHRGTAECDHRFFV